MSKLNESQHPRPVLITGREGTLQEEEEEQFIY